LVLGQAKIDDKSNEIAAILALLTRLDITGAVITIDAVGCQKKIAQQIVQQQGDYVLSLERNHGTLHEDVETNFYLLPFI
jgi:predicted transposase YbfD/YdcC